MSGFWNRGPYRGRTLPFPKGPWRQLCGEDSPVFALDWTNGTTARDGTTPTTATRASSAYRTDWDGSKHTLTLVGTNVIRVGSFNDGTTTYNNVEIEGAATNLMTYSEDFSNAAWTKVGATAGTGGTSRDPSKTMGRFTTGTLSAGQSYWQSPAITVTASTDYAFSIDVKKLAPPGTLDHMRIAVVGVTGTPQAYYNIGARTVGTESNAAGYYDTTIDRVILAFNTGTATSINIRINAAAVDNNAAITTASPTDFADFWGAQLETGSYATSYIPTTSASATRAADSLVYILPEELAPPYTVKGYVIATPRLNHWVGLNDGGASGDRLEFFGTPVNWRLFVDSAEEASSFGSQLPVSSTGVWLEMTGAADGSDVSLYEGTVVKSTTSRAGPDDIDRLTVGSNFGLNGQGSTIGPIKIYDKIKVP